MKLMNLVGACFVAVGSMSPVSTAMAYDAGDWLVRGRVININPNDDSGRLYTTAGDLGEGVTVTEDTVPELDITYMINPHWGVELILGYSTHEVGTRGQPAAIGLGRVIDSKVLPPTLTLQYHFLPNESLRPYVGAGINYTYFFDEKVQGILDKPGAKVKLASSWGLAVQAGLDIAIDDDWFVNLDVKYIDIETKASFRGINLVGAANINTQIDPVVYGIGIGRRF